MAPIYKAFQTLYASIVDEVSKSLGAEGLLTTEITTLLEKLKTTKNDVGMAQKKPDLRPKAALRFQSLVDHVYASARDNMSNWKKTDWISRSSGYEKSMCMAIGLSVQMGRYKDANFVDKKGKFIEIEIKKGQRIMWINMLRYAEMYRDFDKYKDHVTMFVEYDLKRNSVKTISFIEMHKMMELIQMTDELSDMLIRFHNICSIDPHTNKKRSICCQMDFTCDELKGIASVIIDIASLKTTYNSTKHVENRANDEVENAKKGRRTAADIHHLLEQNQLVKHTVYDRRYGSTSVQVARYDKSTSTFIDDVTEMRYKTLNNMGVLHLLKVFGTRRTLSVWESCKAYTTDDTWLSLHKLYEQQKIK